MHALEFLPALELLPRWHRAAGAPTNSVMITPRASRLFHVDITVRSTHSTTV